MNKIKLACLSTLLFTGVVSASTPCNGFELKIKNNLTDNLIVTSIDLNGADLNPGSIAKIDAGSEQVFTVNNSKADLPMIGDFTFYTVSVPTKKVKIKYELKNLGIACIHTDLAQEGDFNAVKSRAKNQVHYDINYK